MGAAVITPQTLTIIATVFPADRRGAAMGVWGGVIGLATVAGPVLGGLLVDGADWRWIFYVNVPIGVVALIGALRVLPDVRPGRPHRLDLKGAALSSAGLFCVVYGLIEGQRHEWGAVWGPITIPMILGAGIALLIAFVLWEKRPDEPLLPLSLFGNRRYSLMLWLQALIAFGMLGFFLPLVLVLQSVLDMSALQAGLTLAPLSLAAMFTAPVAGKMADKNGGMRILIVGMTLFAAGIGLLIPVFSTDASQLSFMLPMIVAGIGLGMCLAPLTAEAMRNIQPQQMGSASGMLNTSRQLGALLGTAVVGAILQNRLAASLETKSQDVAPTLAVPSDVRTQFVDTFANASGTGFQVAPGQYGAAALPSDLPSQTAAIIQQAAHDVFVNAFVASARPSVLVPAAVVAVGVVSCLAVLGRRRWVVSSRSRRHPGNLRKSSQREQLGQRVERLSPKARRCHDKSPRQPTYSSSCFSHAKHHPR